jgi:DNA polymerase III delta prime subunit
MKDTMKDAWETIIGNRHVLESLARVARSTSLGHAYLFSGPKGTGKLLAALAFVRELNCRCGEDGGTADGGSACDSCVSLDNMSHPEVLLLRDVNSPRWLKREALIGRLGLAGPDAGQSYRETVLSVFEKGYLEAPLPRLDRDARFDGFTIATDHLFGKGAAPSKESYTPGPVSDAIRKGFDRGDLAEAEFRLLKELYEFPLSVMPYRGSIPLAYVTSRRDWKFTRPIQAFLSVRSMLGARKAVVIDDAEKMREEAQNCILKTLEEPPPDSVIILVTSDKQALASTIASRCQVVSFDRLTRAEMRIAVGELVGDAGDDLAVLSALSENCPGKLLELVNADVAERLAAVRDYFTAVGKGRAENAFTLASSTLEEAGAHRKRVQAAVRQVLELVVFWTTEIVRVKQGLPGRIESTAYSGAAALHARDFDEAALLEASALAEKGFDVAGWNVDMALLLHTVLLGIAQVLGPAA